MQGRVLKYGDNVDTDVILPARYIILSDPKELAQHAMEDIDREFTKKVNPGDIMVVGENFGCGSSREHAPIALKASGVGCIIAKSFARIFYRNAINTGLPILECPAVCDELNNDDVVEVDFDTGVVKNLSNGQSYQAQSFPEAIRKIMDAGGLIKSIQRSMN